MQAKGDAEHEDEVVLSDAWWAAFAIKFLHPVQVQIIEAFRYLDQPLTVRQIGEIVESVEPVHLDYHLGRLRTLGVLKCGHLQPATGFMDVRYWLVTEGMRRGPR